MLSASPDIINELAAALALHQAGRLAAAEAGYRRALDAAPAQPLALHLLGVLLLGAGRAGEAVGMLRQAETARVGNFDTRLALADACAATGATDEALGRYRGLLADRPDHAAALVNYANALRDGGDLAAAVPWRWLLHWPRRT